MNRIYINIKDWYEDARKNNVQIRGFDDMAQYIVDGFTPRRVGQWCFALIAAEESPPDLLPDAKHLLSTGAFYHVGLKMRTTMETIEPPDFGKPQRVRKYNHHGYRLSDLPIVDDGDEVVFESEADTEFSVDGGGWAEVGSDLYLENAIRGLLEVEPGGVRNRLAQIAVSGGDVRENATAFISIVEDMAEQILAEPTLQPA